MQLDKLHDALELYTFLPNTRYVTVLAVVVPVNRKYTTAPDVRLRYSGRIQRNGRIFPSPQRIGTQKIPSQPNHLHGRFQFVVYSTPCRRGHVECMYNHGSPPRTFTLTTEAASEFYFLSKGNFIPKLSVISFT